MDKTEKSSKMLGNFLVDFLKIWYQKVKNYFGLSIRHPLAATIDVIQLNVPALKSLFENHFWTLFYNPDHCALLRSHALKKCNAISLIKNIRLPIHFLQNRIYFIINQNMSGKLLLRQRLFSDYIHFISRAIFCSLI